jgi:outer membrane protein OmpA-like peptidoglycan-associated protein
MNLLSKTIYSKASGFFLLAFFFFSAVKGQEISPLRPLNSPYDEQNPVVSPNGELFFTVGFHPENSGGPTDFGDIWYSKKEGSGAWQKPQRLGDLSTTGNDVLVGFSDALTALVYHSGHNGKKQGIHQYSRFGNSWKYLRPLEMGNFKNNGTYFSGTLSTDGNTLVMSMASFGSFGNEDIYVSFKQSESVWTSPLNLGPQINTYAQEHTPYLSEDLQVIYFSSNFKDNRRGKDIFYSQRIGTDWNKWTAPLPVSNTNSQGSEMSYMKLPGGEGHAIFTSTQNSEGFGDFFMIKFQEIEPLVAAVEPNRQQEQVTSDSLLIIEKAGVEIEEKVNINKSASGFSITNTTKVATDTTPTVTKITQNENPTEKPVLEPAHDRAAINILDASTKYPIEYKIEIGNERGLKREIASQGQLWTELEDAQWVNISINSKGYLPQLFDKNSFVELEGKEILLNPAVAGTAIILENIQFNRGTSDFADAKSIQVLDDLVLFLKENSSITIRLEGHTDNAGDPSLNKDLSMKRASKIRGYFTLNGIEFERIRISGWGGTRPIADNNTEDGRIINRRVEMLIEK